MYYLCPVQAYGDWVEASNITVGYVFRRLASGDRISENNQPMVPNSDKHSLSSVTPCRLLTCWQTAEYFLEMFRNNLLDIGVDHIPYGTHSFHRGGCQWMSVDLRWPLRKICEWGGWSMEYSHMTIVKYLISWNDDPSQTRDEFYNFNRAPVKKCFACGRSCTCS